VRQRFQAYEAGRDFLRPILPDLLAAGWTRRELFGVNPDPGLWGLAWRWRTTWGRFPVEPVFDPLTGAIEWYVHEPHRTAKMEILPRARMTTPQHEQQKEQAHERSN
jgi:hypothetical protein